VLNALAARCTGACTSYNSGTRVGLIHSCTLCLPAPGSAPVVTRHRWRGARSAREKALESPLAWLPATILGSVILSSGSEENVARIGLERQYSTGTR